MDGSYLALMVELIHTSSLLIDDLPSMDNDVERRGKPTTKNIIHWVLKWQVLLCWVELMIC